MMGREETTYFVEFIICRLSPEGHKKHVSAGLLTCPCIYAFPTKESVAKEYIPQWNLQLRG